MPSIINICCFIILASVCLNTVLAAETFFKCWRCSTDSSNGEFCNDTFDMQNATAEERYWNYVNCKYNVDLSTINARPVCRKLVQEVYGKRVITRSCGYEYLDDPPNKCANDTTPSYIKTVFCQTCRTEGCNGVGGLMPYATFIVLTSLTIALFK